MKAIVQNGYGTADAFAPAVVAEPVIRANEVLVRVRAAGVDRGVWHFMAGRPYAIRLALGLRGPTDRVPGMDVAGTVTAVGSAVTRFAVGDDVCGVGRGTFAEFTAASADQLVPKPAGLSFEQAGVLAVSGVTALQALRDAGRVEAGQHVLVTGASGGVGSYAVQLARALGATVTGECTTSKIAFVESLGADHVLDHTTTDFAEGGRRYDLIVDVSGRATVARLRSALTPRGTLVLVGEGAGKWTGTGRPFGALVRSPFVRQRLTMMIAKQRHTDMAALGGFVEAGTLVPAVGTTFPLIDAAEAMRRLVAGRTHGKIALTV